jgi:hypothetical protein
MPRSWKLALVVIPCVAMMLACGGVAAVNYNNELAKVTKDLEVVSKDFDGELTRSAGDPAKLKEAHNAVMAKADTIIKRGRALTPPDTAEGKALHVEFMGFLDLQDEFVRVEYGNIVNALSTGDGAGVLAANNRIQQKSDEKLRTLKAAQQNFAKANNFKLQ